MSICLRFALAGAYEIAMDTVQPAALAVVTSLSPHFSHCDGFVMMPFIHPGLKPSAGSPLSPTNEPLHFRDNGIRPAAYPCSCSVIFLREEGVPDRRP